MIIAVDVDEVLSELLSKVLEYYNGIYNTKLTKEKCSTYHWHENFGIDLRQMLDIYKKFVDSGKLKELEVVQGAVDGINMIKDKHELVVVTSRAMTLRKDTEFWLDKYFPNSFKDVIYLRKDVYGPMIKSKSQVCKKLKSSILIEDDIDYLKDFREGDTRVLVFNKPWNQNLAMTANFKRVNSWEDIVDDINN